jgi:hypothetical protein
MTATTLTSNYPSSDHNDVAALTEDEELIRYAKSVANQIEEQKQQQEEEEEARDEEAAPSEVDIFLSRLGLKDFVTGVGSVVSEIASEITSIADDVSVDIENRTIDAEARIRERCRAVEERERLEADMSDEDSVELTAEQAKKVKGSPKTLMKLCKKLESQEWDLRKAEKYYDKVEDEVADTREKIRALSAKLGLGNVIYEENDVTLDDFKVKGNRRTLRNLIKKLQKQDKQLKKADEAVIKVEDEIKKTQKKIKVLSQKFGLQGAQEHSSSRTRMSYYDDDEEDDLESVGEQLGDAFKAAGDEIAYLAPILARVVGKNIDDAHQVILKEIFPVDTGDED